MALGALVAAGVALGELQAALDALPVEPIRLQAKPVQRGGVAATRVIVEAAESSQRRSFADIAALLSGSRLASGVAELSLATFERLARAEATAHGCRLEEVHFHEVGALDSIADIVGAAAGLKALGVAEVGCSFLALGGGSATSSHGELPVPTPAVLGVLREAGAPVVVGGADFELTTPTGAAILAACVDTWGPSPAMSVSSFGFGAGSRTRRGAANVAELVVGELSGRALGGADGDAGCEWLMLEANVDDLDPRLWPGVLRALLDAGAVDAWLSPVLMKKGRPAHTVHALAKPPAAQGLPEVLYRETSTIGVRCYPVTKQALEREFVAVDVSGASVRVKVARLDGSVLSATPEFADVIEAAQRLGRSAREVLASANAEAQRLLMPRGGVG